jgi:hypothetical protein
MNGGGHLSRCIQNRGPEKQKKAVFVAIFRVFASVGTRVAITQL